MPAIRPGLRFKSAVCSAEIMIVRGSGEPSLTCGGAPMAGPNQTADAVLPKADEMGGCQIGKRYVNADQSLEVLCIKAGKGTLAASGAALVTKEAKKLPSSD